MSGHFIIFAFSAHLKKKNKKKQTKKQTKKNTTIVNNWDKTGTLSSLQTRTDTFANSLDPNETARNEPSHPDLHSLPFCFGFCAYTPTFNNGHA